MIVVRIPNTFVAERNYSIDVLMRDFLGLDIQIDIGNSNDSNYCIQLENGKKLVIEDHFFVHFRDDLEYLDAANIPTQLASISNDFTHKENLSIIYGNSKLTVGTGTIICGCDVFASSFFMLTRWEEHVAKSLDQHGRFPAVDSLAFKCNFLSKPIVNEYGEMLWAMLQSLGCSQLRKKRKFSMVISHDVDFPLRWQGIDGLRSLAGSLLMHRNPRLAIAEFASMLSTKLAKSHDPYDTFDWLMDVSEQVGATSRFFFKSGGRSSFDHIYSIRTPFIQNVLRKINGRGHVIGLHPSYEAFNNKVLWKHEFDELSDVSPQQVTQGRNHFLRFENPLSWQLYENSGMRYDSTLGYADHEGFRCGMCDDYPVFNILTRQPLKLRELPLMVMEGTFIHYKKLNPLKTAEAISSCLKTVKKYQGKFVFLWHNSSFNTPVWDPYTWIYLETIKRGAMA